MIAFVARRFAWAAFALFVVVTGVFLTVSAVGDPASANLGPRASPEARQAYRVAHGLNRPLGERYLAYVGGVLRGDLGTSFRDEQPVTRVILTRLPRTLFVGALALFFEIAVGVSLGIVAGWKRNTPIDTLVTSFAILGICAPTFVTGELLLDWAAFRMGWFPVGGYGVDALDHLHHAILPALTLAIIGAATYARVMRSEMIDVLRADFVRTARAKGAAPMRVLLVHAARNALLPILTLIGLSLPLLVSGAVITESIFAWPGMGSLMVQSITNLDVPMVMGGVLVGSATVQLGNLLADIGVAAIDPRVRLGGG